MIRDEATEGHSILELCEMLEVSASGYYAWASRKPGKRQKADQELTEQIREVHKASRRTYGSLPRSSGSQAHSGRSRRTRSPGMDPKCGSTLTTIAPA